MINDVFWFVGVFIKMVLCVFNNEVCVLDVMCVWVMVVFVMFKYWLNMVVWMFVGYCSFQIVFVCDNFSFYYVYEMQFGIWDCCLFDGIWMIVQFYDYDFDWLIDDIESLIDGLGIDGLILMLLVIDYFEVLVFIECCKMWFVCVLLGIDFDLIVLVFIDNVGVVMVMMWYLLVLGYCWIGFIMGYVSYVISVQWFVGYCVVLDEVDIVFDFVLVCFGDYDFVLGVDVIEVLFVFCWLFSVVFVFNDDMVVGVFSVVY